ncbi:MAG TPA: hypothetical protein VLH39_03120 [Magnetospirillaceae bacterium]|nr:hypothetical protein [Magnetospirillaceae bacterium]
MDLRFYKLHVCGIDWLLVDQMGENTDPVPDYAVLARDLCRRRRGAGGQGLLAISRPERDVWAECFDPAGRSIPLSPCAALCAARYLFDSGRGGRGVVELRTREGMVKVDVIDSTQFALSLGPALSPSGVPLREGEANRAAATLDISGKAISILPVRFAGDTFAVVLAEDSLREALAPFGPISRSARDKSRTRFIPLAARVLSRNRLAAAGRHHDACTAAGAALAAACTYGLADREAAVRIGGDVVFINWDAADGLYAAARPAYIFSGEFWMEERRDGAGPS